jgi:hypothetical protein
LQQAGHHTEVDDIVARIETLVSPRTAEHELEQRDYRLDLLRRRLEHTLADLGLDVRSGVQAVLIDGRITIQARNLRSADRLLAVLDHHANHHHL